ncbi:sensor histidine kinase [Flavobacterium sp.]|uniref:sensor histidine kinase n=1 Tax=Flavobacterium sp. TaxID=239 RepID=UPI0040346DA7
MTKRLLHKTLRYYVFYSLVILVVAAVLFFYLARMVYRSDADRELSVLREEFVRLTIPGLEQGEIAAWNSYNRDMKIKGNSKGFERDTLYYHSYYNCLSEKYERYRVLNSPVRIGDRDYIFSAKINVIGSDELIMGIVGVFTIVMALLLVGLLFITGRLSLTLWKPFYTTLNQIERFEIDKMQAPELAITGIAEFDRLNQAITKLIAKNTLIYASHGEFVENASHELQTPLAIFKAMLQTLVQRPDITPGQFELLENINIAASRLSKINKNLLLLSKLESTQFDAMETLSVNALVERHLPFFIEQASALDIDIQYGSEAPISVLANPVLLEIAINNLLLNAVRHNRVNGSIAVTIGERFIRISNTGATDALDGQRLFERFSKANTSASGSGLGLSIVKRITVLNQWKITYYFSGSLHFFQLEL